eukprot:13256361-Alexandrium_andersonii.AAC.1
MGAQVRQGEGHRDAGGPAGEQLPAREGRAPQVQGSREAALDRGGLRPALGHAGQRGAGWLCAKRKRSSGQAPA